MKTIMRIFSVIALLSVLAGCTAVAPAAPAAPAAQEAAPAAANTVVVADVERAAAPAFDSACAAADEGVVVPVDIMPDRPLKIAVLGLENNPFWIPVKEGTLKAAEELKPYNVTVDWIVPGASRIPVTVSRCPRVSVIRTRKGPAPAPLSAIQ